MIRYNNITAFTSVYLGNRLISKVYSSDKQVFPSSTPPTPSYSGQYLTFVAQSDGTFKFSGNSIDYSLDGGATWTTLASDTNSPTVSASSKILWKATLTPTSEGIGAFSSTANFTVEGNPMSLLFGDDFKGQASLSGKDYAFRRLFSGNTNVTNAENLSLPATTLANFCYQYMFRGCTSLTTAPELPATTLGVDCYAMMFEGCINLTTAPSVLPATTLADYCYLYMFGNCTNLTTAPSLPATTLASNCYEGMFMGCTSLTTAPQLPATTLATRCYYYMFESCINLTTAPSVLPATTLAERCYDNMFSNCSSLTTAPQLPAATLVTECYLQMFDGCTNLNNITCLATNISASNCTKNWVFGVAANGTFTKASSMNRWGTCGTSKIPCGWTVVDNT